MVYVAWGAGSKLRVFFICAKLWNPFYETLRWKLVFSRHRLLAIMLPPLNENCSAQLEGKQKDLCCTYGSRKQCGFYFSSPRNKSWELASFLEKAFIMATFKILMMTRRWPKTWEGEGGGRRTNKQCWLQAGYNTHRHNHCLRHNCHPGCHHDCQNCLSIVTHTWD